MSQQPLQAKYRAHTNIALIKYWGKRDADLYLPMTSSLSLTLDALYTDTEVVFSNEFEGDSFVLNGEQQTDKELGRISRFVDLFRKDFNVPLPAQVKSTNHVPTAAGLASSASAYAALASAINSALNLNLDNQTLSTYARQGSGSATRSLFGGFSMWHKGENNDSHSSYAEQIDEADWDVAMVIIIVNKHTKKVSSREGMQHTIDTSPFYALWPEEVEKDLNAILPAVKGHDLPTIGRIAEHNAMKMHATIIAANPSLTYWEPDSLVAMQAVRELREQGFECYFTMDAGPNVKVLCRHSDTQAIKDYLLQHFTPEQLVMAKPGPAPYALD